MNYLPREVINADQEVPNNEVFRDDLHQNGPIGPLELSILERVETGLINSSVDNEIQETKSINQKNNLKRYKGPKEIIFVSGWICIDSIYQRFFWSFVSKILIGKYLYIYIKLRNSYTSLFNESKAKFLASCSCFLYN